MTGRPPERPALRVRGLTVEFRVRGGAVMRSRRLRAVDDVDLQVGRGQAVGLVGESGCGKSTLARAVLRLEEPTAGEVEVDGHRMTGARGDELRAGRRQVAMLFQDPYASLSPRMTVEEVVEEPLRIHRRYTQLGGRRHVQGTLELVGLTAAHLHRHPFELSGGQRQRVALARALILRPKLLILDEPVSALDVLVQAQIIELLRRTQRELGLAMLFISHDLAVVRSVAERVAVMYLGRIVEEGDVRAVYERPAHPYTCSLLSAVPRPGRRASDRIVLAGEVPDPVDPPTGCRFRTRCWKAERRCATTAPELTGPTPRRAVACHFPVEAAQTAAPNAGR